MSIKNKFYYHPSIDVIASQIGISKWNWIDIKEDNESKAKIIMKENRFDVLPISESDNSIFYYFSTREWNNYKSLNKLSIKKAPKVYYQMSLKDLIRKFKKEESHYYFLTDENEILGLVSYVNLNCQLVYNYLFQVISDIERSVSDLLKKSIKQEELINYFKNSENNHLNKIVLNFENAIKTNSDNDIFQHLYLQDIGILLNKFENRIPYNKKRILKFKKKFSPENTYTLLRNKIMHPVRPILSSPEIINKMDELLVDYEIIKDTIDNTNE